MAIEHSSALQAGALLVSQPPTPSLGAAASDGFIVRHSEPNSDFYSPSKWNFPTDQDFAEQAPMEVSNIDDQLDERITRIVKRAVGTLCSPPALYVRLAKRDMN